MLRTSFAHIYRKFDLKLDESRYYSQHFKITFCLLILYSLTFSPKKLDWKDRFVAFYHGDPARARFFPVDS